MENITVELKVLSSLEKCFPDEDLSSHPAQSSFTGFREQRISFQLAMYKRAPLNRYRGGFLSVRFSGPLADYVKVRMVTCMGTQFPCHFNECDDNYLRTTPGLYPELLRPLHYRGRFILLSEQPQCLWIDVLPPADFPAGSYTLTAELMSEEGELLSTQEVSIRLLDMTLPPQTLIHTEWFHTDCIANAHRTTAFSERHWKLIERYLRTAVENGINMILTPVFTPALDTAIGGERLTTQLLDITVEAPGVYRFGFDKLDRWVDLCRSVGVEYYEIPHLFTQWGAEHAPKFVATVNGKKKKIFGWETDACGEEYRSFLAQMLTALVEFLERRGIADHTFFHVSDEPHLPQLEQYTRCKNMIAPYIKNYPIIDALSDYAFYESGVLTKPVPGIRSIKPFLENDVKGLWAYYCGASGYLLTGRMYAMPLARTRILGLQLYLANIEGFLHWGYNFYNNQCSYEAIDPFLFTDAELFIPAGDAALVYPGENDTPWESIRLNAMREAMEDMRLLQLCESLCGREATVQTVHDLAGMTVTFAESPTDAAFLLNLREKLIAMVENAK